MRARLGRARSEEGFTLIELLVASAMGAVVMSAVAMLVIGAVKGQPRISKQAQNITTARWVLDRLTHELRNGLSVSKAEPDEVSFQAYVRRSTCGGSAALPAGTPAIKCQVTYSCTTTACSRAESEPGTYTGIPKEIFSGINSSQVFTYVPEVTESSEVSEVTYVKVTLSLPEPDGVGAFTVSSGTSLRNATLGY
ncbi:MAG TPA: prepilin-type N-terminal cleavage/methylation domain-containing protein [Solirubrobacterales bacterium]|nr:prepilin-type N-terminal cleavage/methylation domain-containing protein [Solirubrobacterales bacterium]